MYGQRVSSLVCLSLRVTFSQHSFFLHQVIKVREAKEWQMRPGTPIRQQEYDWTWGTDYAGSCRLQGVGVNHSEVRSRERKRKTLLLYFVPNKIVWILHLRAASARISKGALRIETV